MRVRASSAFVPELTQTREGDPLHFFAYSIRLGLLSEEEQAAAAAAVCAYSATPLRSAQLRTRHWLIRGAEGKVESEVRGEAVVGHYPLLKPGAPLPPPPLLPPASAAAGPAIPCLPAGST